MLLVDCGDPHPPINGLIRNYSTTTEGANISFTCEDGFIPDVDIIAICFNNGIWNPLPINYTCMDGK